MIVFVDQNNPGTMKGREGFSKGDFLARIKQNDIQVSMELSVLESIIQHGDVEAALFGLLAGDPSIAADVNADLREFS